MPEPITLRAKIGREHQGLTLLDFLCARFPYRDRAGWQAEIAAGALAVGGEKASASRRLRAGELCTYTVTRQEPWVRKDISMLWEDDFLIFVNKPAPLPSHADGTFIRHTLIALMREARPGQPLFLGHRLDRETSGVTVLAKSRAALAALMSLFQRGEVKKRYLALVRGTPPQDAFEVSGGIARDPASRIPMRWKLFPSGTSGTKESRTRFRVLKRLEGRTLLECEPLSGRTNQIRVHLEAAGLPIVGDKLYGQSDEAFLEFLEHVKKGGDSRFGGRLEAERHMLHAASLELRHPITREELKVEAPLPDDFQNLLQSSNPPAA